MTQQKITFSVTPRTLMGKKVKQLRSQGMMPGNVMGNSVASTPVSINTNQFIKLYDQVGDTGLFYLEIEGEKTPRPVLVVDVEADAMSGIPQHVVFKQVNLTEKITAEIPVELVGEFKLAGAVLLTVHDSIEVEALPADFPEKFEIDVTGLTEIDQAVTFNDLNYDRSKITLMVGEEELDTPVVLVQEVREEPVEEEAPAEAAEGEAAPTEAPAETEAAE